MNKAFPLFLSVLLFCNWSCVKEETHSPALDNSFNINDQHFNFTSMTSYHTDYGVLLAFDELPEVKLWMVLSEGGKENYLFGQEVRAVDSTLAGGAGKAYAVLEFEGKVYRSLSGSLEMGQEDGINEGSFDISFPDGISISGGQLREENIAERPCKMFKDVLLTDENGQPLNNAMNAWQSDEEWTSLEWSFFQSSYGDIISGEEIRMQGIFPNPFKDVFRLGLSADKSPDLFFVIVNDNFETILDYKNVFPLSTGQNALSLDANNMFGLTRNDTFRMYYIIRTEDGYIKGHGDIMRN